MVEEYLYGRWIEYLAGNRKEYRGRGESRAPQGSVLDPFLWNIGYDTVLHNEGLPKGVSLVCYTDDTMMLVKDR